MSTIQIASGQYTLDPVRSTVGFQRKTFWGLMAVKGVFGSVEGRGTVDADGTAEGGLVVDVASIDSKHTKRDTHLRSKDMLDAESFPKITFDAERITPTGSSTAEVEGRLTVRGTSRKLSYPVSFKKQGTDAVVLRGAVTIDPAQFGLKNPLGMMKGPAVIDLDLRFTA
ncbi:YceI family protein [Streptomyces sp. NPDC060275]|uniref:YceI family protein n=1 Tax=Streptomyces sp. NPDC060275 TaxID=3347090 RepID=UPI00365C5E16